MPMRGGPKGMKPRLRQQQTKGNQSRRPERVASKAVLRSAGAGRADGPRFDIKERNFVQEEVLGEAAEAAPKKSEEYFRLIFERSTVGMVISDTRRRVIRANKSFCGFVGFSEDELRQRSLLDLTHAEDREAIRASLAGIQ